ncbi:DUF397 domain-containing protein [Streptomyces echinatus]|uniref:DUF397 domain-containing protein n=1 Tax=Streptomyces echinatus TaxID=67293 RepID=UPI00379D3D4B
MIRWFKSSYSSSADPDSCIEVAPTASTIHIRDSKQTGGDVLTVAPASWVDFVSYAARR